MMTTHSKKQRRKHKKVHKPIISTNILAENKKPHDALSKSQKKKLKAKTMKSDNASATVSAARLPERERAPDKQATTPTGTGSQQAHENQVSKNTISTPPSKVQQIIKPGKLLEKKAQIKSPKQRNSKARNHVEEPDKKVKKPAPNNTEKTSVAHKINTEHDKTQKKGVNSASKLEKVIAKKRQKKLKWKQKQMQMKLEREKRKENTQNIHSKAGMYEAKSVQMNTLQTDSPKAKKNMKKKVETIVHKATGSDASKVKAKGAQALLQEREGASSNWKKLQQELAATQKKTYKRKPMDNQRNNGKQRKVDTPAKVKDTHQSEAEIWFDDVDEILLDRKLPLARMPSATADKPSNTDMPTTTASDTGPETTSSNSKNPLVKDDAFKGVTKIVAMDCEMVGVGDGSESVLARVSIVNQYGEPVYDKFVKPRETVVDYRTHVSGIRPQDLVNGERFETVQKEVSDILKDKLLVGHAIMNDLKVLFLSHPRRKIRDTSRYKKFRQVFGGRTPSLKKLSEKLLAVAVQEGEHNSVQDAQAAMRLYTMYRKQWETELRGNKFGHRKPT